MDHTAISPGSRFGDDRRYIIDARLGGGVFGEVWRAEDTHRGTVVALKVLRYTTPSDAWHEATRLTELESPYILRVNNAAMALDVPFLDTALAAGGTLASSAAPHGLAVPDAVGRIREMLRGLELCHQRRLLHRDVKPENVFLTGNGRAQLGDFGVSAFMDVNGEAPCHGDPAIRAPEVLRGGACTVLSDVYSAGLTLYAVLVGDLPHKWQDYDPDVNAIAAVRLAGIPHLRDIAPHVSRSLARVVERAMHEDPAHRYSTAAEFDDALGSLRPGRRALGRCATHPGHTMCWTAIDKDRQAVSVCAQLDSRAWSVEVRRSSGIRLRRHCLSGRGERQLAIHLRRVFDDLR